MRMILTPDEVAKELKMSNTETRRMLADGKIKAFKIGANWKIPRSLLEKQLEEWAIRETEARSTRSRSK